MICLQSVKKFNISVKVVSQVFLLWFLFAVLFINVNYKIMNKVIINKSYSNVVLFLEVIVYMEELNKLMENCESVLHIPNCSDVID